jgi:hypothetical protein
MMLRFYGGVALIAASGFVSSAADLALRANAWAFSAPARSTTQTTARVEIRRDAPASQFVVTIDGRPFTSYQHGAAYADKTAFYPVVSPNGARVNREYPMVEHVPGESADHPHHQSVFFAYDEVNGTNFWNPDPGGRRIEHVATTAAGATLSSRLAWKNKAGVEILEEHKRVTFGGTSDVSWMDHDITLVARVPVTMGDTKEGAFAIRLNDTLKEAGGSGRYINAEGLETAANVWGKPSDWVAIRGVVRDARGSHEVTVAIAAARDGANAPPYWHARDYGLFAVNPFGRKAFDSKADSRITRLAPGEQVRVRYRLSVYAGQVSKARLDADYRGMQ